MAKIKIYPLKEQPTLLDRFIISDVNTPEEETKQVTVESIIDMFNSNWEVVDNGHDTKTMVPASHEDPDDNADNFLFGEPGQAEGEEGEPIEGLYYKRDERKMGHGSNVVIRTKGSQVRAYNGFPDEEDLTIPGSAQSESVTMFNHTIESGGEGEGGEYLFKYIQIHGGEVENPLDPPNLIHSPTIFNNIYYYENHYYASIYVWGEDVNVNGTVIDSLPAADGHPVSILLCMNDDFEVVWNIPAAERINTPFTLPGPADTLVIDKANEKLYWMAIGNMSSGGDPADATLLRVSLTGTLEETYQFDPYADIMNHDSSDPDPGRDGVAPMFLKELGNDNLIIVNQCIGDVTGPRAFGVLPKNFTGMSTISVEVLNVMNPDICNIYGALVVPGDSVYLLCSRHDSVDPELSKIFIVRHSDGGVTPDMTVKDQYPHDTHGRAFASNGTYITMPYCIQAPEPAPEFEFRVNLYNLNDLTLDSELYASEELGPGGHVPCLMCEANEDTGQFEMIYPTADDIVADPFSEPITFGFFQVPSGPAPTPIRVTSVVFDPFKGPPPGFVFFISCRNNSPYDRIFAGSSTLQIPGFITPTEATVSDGFAVHITKTSEPSDNYLPLYSGGPSVEEEIQLPDNCLATIMAKGVIALQTLDAENEVLDTYRASQIINYTVFKREGLCYLLTPMEHIAHTGPVPITGYPALELSPYAGELPYSVGEFDTLKDVASLYARWAAPSGHTGNCRVAATASVDITMMILPRSEQELEPEWHALGGGLGAIGWGLDYSSDTESLYVVGAFMEVDTDLSAARVAAWNILGWSALGTLSGSSGGVYCVQYYPRPGSEKLYVGMSRYGEIDSLREWDGTEWTDSIVSSGEGETSMVISIAIKDYGEHPGPSGATHDIYLGGYFNGIGVPGVTESVSTNNIGLLRVIPDGPNEVWGFSMGVDASVQSVVIDPNSDDVYIGGAFVHTLDSEGDPDIEVNRIAKWTGSAWEHLGSGLSDNCRNIIIDKDSGDLFAVGDFTYAGGIEVNKVAKWSEGQWHSLGSGVDEGFIRTVAIHPETKHIYVGGVFSSIGGVEANSVAYWDGIKWNNLEEGLTEGGKGPSDVRDLKFIPDPLGGYQLIATGDFNKAGQITAHNIARWGK